MVTAVAPQSKRLTPFVGVLEEAVRRAVADVTGLSEADVRRIRRNDDSLVFDVAASGKVILMQVDAVARRQARDLRVRAVGLDGSHRKILQQSLGRPRGELEGRMAALAQALDQWWPFAGLSDEEFRKVSSSPEGQYGTLRLGYRCNQDCWFCWQDRSGPMPPLGRFEAWLDELAALGVTSINFTGGEVTTVPTLPALIDRAAHHHGLMVSIQSNAVKLSRADYLATLVDSGLKAVMVSLHSADAAVSDAMTRAPGTHRRTVEGIRAALNQGLYVSITCVVEAANVEDLPAHADFVIGELQAASSDNRIRRVTYAHPTDYFDPGRWREQQVPFDVLRPRLSEAVARLQHAGVPVQIGGPCGFPLCALDPSVVSQAYEVVSRDGYHDLELTHRRYGRACDECQAKDACFGLRQEYLERFGERGLKPVRGAPSS